MAAPEHVPLPASSPKFSMSSLLGPTPNIFNRILKSTAPTQQSMETQDDKLLEEAMACVPETVQGSKNKRKKVPPMKAQKAKKGKMEKKGKKGRRQSLQSRYSNRLRSRPRQRRQARQNKPKTMVLQLHPQNPMHLNTRWMYTLQKKIHTATCTPAGLTTRPSLWH